ncbi:MAG: hypothetical protein K2L84_05750 [Muribaculaceae bacterium]|nr:hypothetical protein [Muribaculaceae bacterium]
MAKIKEVQSTEVHWKIAEWSIKDQANVRIRQLLAENARFFAPVYVTHAGFYWSDPEAAGWNVLTDAADADRAEVYAKINEIKNSAIARFPAQQARIELVFTRPNDDFVFLRRMPDGSLDFRLTGWGFANFKRAQGGPISDVPVPDTLREVTLSLSIDGTKCPSRPFQLFRGTAWVDEKTDAQGLYSLGTLPPGRKVQFRDIETGKELIEEIKEDTTNIDLDVTEYLTVRVTGRLDNAPLSGDEATVQYGHRSATLRLEYGVAECRMPWLKDVQCKVSLRGESQQRTLEKNILNTFDFNFVTPEIPRTAVRVHVSSDGVPVANEPVTLSFRTETKNLVTDAGGVATTEFEIPQGVTDSCEAKVRDSSATELLANQPVDFYFTFDTPVRDIFNPSLLVVDGNHEPVPAYPVIVEYNGESVNCISDENGVVQLQEMAGGDTMRVYDAADTSWFKDYTLNPLQPQYVFVLPYDNVPADIDCTLRVIEKDGSPSKGTTCILAQGTNRVLARLDDNGEMKFSSAMFDKENPVDVRLYSTRRTFPSLKFNIEPEEKEYELREVDGPTPWWKIAGEIALAIGTAFGLLVYSGLLYGMFRNLPNLFA